MALLKRALAAFRSGLRTLSPTCRDASRLQSEALDQSLPLGKRLGLRLHLLLCRWCRRYGKQLHFLRHTVHEHPHELNTAPRSLSTEARERLKQSLRDESK
jgi:hypothetical protein